MQGKDGEEYRNPDGESASGFDAGKETKTQSYHRGKDHPLSDGVDERAGSCGGEKHEGAYQMLEHSAILLFGSVDDGLFKSSELFGSDIVVAEKRQEQTLT
jgi:hypothetical protein